MFIEVNFLKTFGKPCVMRKHDAMPRFSSVGGHAEEGNEMREIYPSFPSFPFIRPAAYLALACNALILIISYSR